MSKSFASVRLTAAALSMAVLVAPATLRADSYSNTTACLSGSVPAYDYGELMQTFAGWSNSSGVGMVAATGQPTMRVVDSLGNSVCADTANDTATCRFKTGFNSDFTIFVDNTNQSINTTYRLCAF